MVCFTLLFIAILTVSKVTSFSCSNHRPSGSASGNDVPAPQQVATLQYCFIDNRTIMRSDTGEKLDIVYTADSLLVATPTDGHTSVMIAKLDDDIPCLLPTTTDPIGIIVMVTFIMLVVVVNGIVLITHLMFKELHTVFGKLLMLYNLLILCLAFSFVAMTVIILQTGGQLIACHGLVMSIPVVVAGSDMTATCMLHYLVYILYHSYKLQQISEDEFKNLFKWHLTFIFGAMFLVLFLMVSYDVGINRSVHILHGGYCVTKNDDFPIRVINISSHVNKSAQIMLFLVYLYYKYKLNRDVQDTAILRSQDRLLHKIAMVMGATIGIAYLLFSVFVIFGFTPALVATWMLFFIQQYVVMAILLCTKKMKNMCIEYCSKD